MDGEKSHFIPDNADPLIWYMRVKQCLLRFHGFRRHRAAVDGSRFGYYLRSGTDGTAPPLILIHGLAIFPEWWSPLLRCLSRRYTLCVPELIGFGRSPGRELEPDRFNLDLYRRQIRRLKETLGLERMILAGVSLGGWVCLDYALARPEEVHSLILLGPAGASQGVCEEELHALKEVFDYQTPEAFNRLINEYVLYRPRRIQRWMGALAVRRSKHNGHKHLLHNLQYEDWVGARAAAIQAPAALIWGREDKVFPFSEGEALERLMPKARLFPMEQTGHSYMFEQPEPTCRAFLDGMAYVLKTGEVG